MTHPITLPPTLIHKWARLFITHPDAEVFSTVVQWGADQELEAICAWLYEMPGGSVMAEEIRASRRPKPPSLKEQALEVLGNAQKGWGLAEVDLDTIRRALEQLND